MHIDFLKSVLEIPTIYRREELIREFIITFGKNKKIKTKVDSVGNVYLIKGKLNKNKYYPCVISHMDTVHYDQKKLIDKQIKLKIKEDNISGKTILSAENPITKVPSKIKTGIGGDDKCGVAICLDLISKTKNIIGCFFVQEEIGCFGSKNCEIEIFKQVGYVISFDAPTNNWISYVSNNTQLFNQEFYNQISMILHKNNITKINDNDPFTDIFILKRQLNVNTINIFAGYYNWHSKNEFVIFEDVIKARNIGLSMLKKLKNKIYPFQYNEIIQPLSEVVKPIIISN
jgi:tripeptide aminopeptidase